MLKKKKLNNIKSINLNNATTIFLCFILSINLYCKVLSDYIIYIEVYTFYQKFNAYSYKKKIRNDVNLNLFI